MVLSLHDSLVWLIHSLDRLSLRLRARLGRCACIPFFMVSKIRQLLPILRRHYVTFVKNRTSTIPLPTISDLQVLYKSEHFVVVNKREDVLINSDDPTETLTVETQLRHLYPDLVDNKAKHSFRFIHRLDYATSGAICIALTKTGARWGNKAFEKRYVDKHYLALVRGHIKAYEDHQLKIDVGIGRDGSVSDIHKMCTADNPMCMDARSACTTVVVLEHGQYGDKPASKLILVPHTGRTHQLRVHLSYLGHTIVGDYMYSNRGDVSPYRMMLHAHWLRIPMKYDQVDVLTPDTFTPQFDPKWKPTRVFCTREDYVRKINDLLNNSHSDSKPNNKYSVRS